MLKLLLLTLLCGATYAAFTVPYKGHTIADRVIARAKPYLGSHEHPDHPARKPPGDSRQTARKDSPKAPSVAERAPAAPTARPQSSEQITRSDRQALDQLIPR